MYRGQFNRANLIIAVVGLCGVLFITGLIHVVDTDPRLALIGAGLVITILFGALLKPKTLVTMLIIASSLTYFQLPIGTLNLRLDTALVPACLLSCMTHGHMSAFTRQFRRPEIRLVGVYLGFNYAASLAFAPDQASSLKICIWMTLNLIIVALALAVFEHDKQALYRRMYIGAFIVVASGVGGWVLAAKTGATLGAGIDPTQGLRARGVSFEPNILAGIAAIWAVIVLTQQRRIRTGEWLFVALAIAAIPLSTTRAAFVALAIGLCVYILRMGFRVVRLIPVALGGGVVLAIVQVASPATFASISEKFADLRFTNQTSSYRLDSWQVAVREITGTDWLTGHGTNSFGQTHFDPTHPGERLPYYLGNLPLATVYDIGLVGAAVLAIAALVLALRKIPNRHPVRRVAVLTTFLLLSVATSPFFFATYWLFIALALARLKVPSSRAAPAFGLRLDRGARRMAVSDRRYLSEGSMAMLTSREPTALPTRPVERG